ncbi:TPA: DNA-binding protein [Klebsiella pneumoniae]|uniref:Rha family transcriptional regulator n=1 Tax=Klebsiella pneumoniae complex TaxID=3390273 RepID=UPI00031292F3|nr:MULTISPECIES: Rha family transcriptional regulator [Klebsiella]EKZ9939892.1 Rha family transcriptional regulator [Klebsiella pneumoniae]ELA0312215.1 Rha family transcriptional regulator [Klebsiella pneumoniae]ELA2921172.1 Rha family transcriptional regulator [Klebsiella pneumoniae]MBD7023936.1 Rha family transcriptional regulator [Klebsiella pneumoniae]MBD7333068.1 Rha family transcriptional regulator [Klebsiella pneumoniae]
MMMNNLITNKPSMTSLEIAELVEKRHDNVKRTIVTLASKDVIRSPQIEVLERINNLGFAVNDEVYKFAGEEGKRDSIIVVAQLSPEFTARLVDRWKELEEERTRPKSQAELIAEMALLNVEQERRLYQVEEQVEAVAETVENIKRGNMRAGYVGYRQVVAKSGMTDAKCRNLVNAYRIPTDTHEFMTPDGLLSRRAIVELEPFMKAFRQMMAEAEPRGTRWYHPKMGLFQAIGWEEKHCED